MQNRTRSSNSCGRIGRGAVLLALGTLVGACGDDDPAATGDGVASVSFVTPVDGDSIAGGVEFELAAEGVTIEPAREVRDGAGHFHVVADADCVDDGETIPRNADHLHLGQGQASGVIFLEPGRHELCAQVGDGAHAAQLLTDTISVQVGIEDQEAWCAVAEQVDRLIDDPALEDEVDLAVFQSAAENARRLLVQLATGIDHVDPEPRDSVAVALDGGLAFVTAFLEADTLDQAWATVAERASGNDDGVGSAWILETCAVDIDG